MWPLGCGNGSNMSLYLTKEPKLRKQRGEGAKAPVQTGPPGNCSQARMV